MMYEFRCRQGHVTEEIFKISQRPPHIDCEVCGKRANHIISIWARTPGRWGDSTGYYDQSLGTYIENSQHKERVLADKGLVHASDFAPHHADQMIDNSVADKEQHDKNVTRYEASIAEHGDVGRAFAETFPAEEIL